MITLISGAYGPLNVFFLVLGIAAFGVETWAFIDAIIRPPQAYLAAGKLTKTKWLLILGVAFVLGLYSAAYGGVTCFEFNKDDSVSVATAAISHEVLDNLEDGLCLFPCPGHCL